MKNIKAVIFDLNGVFVKSPKLSDRFRDDFGVEEHLFLAALENVMAKVRSQNAGSAFSYWQPYLLEWGITMNEAQFMEYWFSKERADKEMVKIAEQLKQNGIVLFILSNNLRERTKFYNESFPFLQNLFKKVYFSWQTGFIKPDKRAFDLILEENDLSAKECLYFDDSQKNVDFANTLGIESYVFTGALGVREKLAFILNT